MKILARAIISCGMLVSAAGFASADGHTSAGTPWYGELLAGGPIPHDFDLTFLPGGPAAVYDPDSGFLFAASVGKYLTDNIRADINVAYAWAGDGAVTLAGGAVVPHTGTVSNTTIMANAYYEFANVLTTVTPWIGAGVGAAIFNYDNLGGAGFQYNDNDTAFTGALHLGADVEITKMVDFTARYSLNWVASHSVSATTAGAVPISVDSHVNNVFTVGFRVKFGG